MTRYPISIDWRDFLVISGPDGRLLGPNLPERFTRAAMRLLRVQRGGLAALREMRTVMEDRP